MDSQDEKDLEGAMQCHAPLSVPFAVPVAVGFVAV